MEERVAKIDTDQDLVILGNIQIEKRISALEAYTATTDTAYTRTTDDFGAKTGPAAALDVAVEEGAVPSLQETAPLRGEISPRNPRSLEELEPFTAAQHSELNRFFNKCIMNTLDGFIDQLIVKVQTMITNEMQTSFEPACCDFRSQIKMLRNLMQPDQFMQNANESKSVHNSHVANNLMQSGKLVRDGVSSGNHAHSRSDPNLMQTDQFDTGETLQDCIDFDELMNDFHSTAASAKVLRQSLDNTSETLHSFTEPSNPDGFNSSPCSAAFNNSP